ncbi:telomeric repeat binding factor a [Syngnathoides biaculeatus]|uniref:telomeric repeat binding factor a n=1 Tax=Syngnathoides biaculeatus TaxID=300417 RepID=UPI002ADD434C|nr:telomeric repeat binding factor a [Syngnathoides biaculeatus]
MPEQDEIGRRSETEAIVNRWLVDYYIWLAFEFFDKDQYQEFRTVRKVIDSIIVRLIAKNNVMVRKLRVIQLLAMVNEGEHLDVTFTKGNDFMSPLESALVELEHLSNEIDVQQEDVKNVCASVKEMIVKLFIKNKDFMKAKQALCHFPKSMVLKKKMFMHLINKKSNNHKVIEELDFKQLKDEISAFCLKICTFSVPLLHRTAREVMDRHNQNHKRTTTEVSDEYTPSMRTSTPVNIHMRICEHSIIPKGRLKLAYQALAAGVFIPFSQLEEEVENEATLPIPAPEIDCTTQYLESEEPFQRDTGRPLEAGPPSQTDAPPQSKTGSPCISTKKKMDTALKWQHQKIAMMVVQPDSQPILLQATSREQEVPVSVQELAESQTVVYQMSETDTEVVPLTRPESPTPTTSRSPSDDEPPRQSEEQPSIVPVSRRTCNRTLTNGTSTRSEVLSVTADVPETPVKKRSIYAPSKFMGNSNFTITDSSLDSSPSIHRGHLPQKCSTPNKDATSSKWKTLFLNAKETKDTWNQEEELFTVSIDKSSSSRKRKWTEEESQKLRDGVKKFGEGNWSKIKAYYKFHERTNVHLKDRWRTMKKLNLI